MSKQAIEFAIKYKIALGMDEDSYFIRNPHTGEIVWRSLRRNAKSAIIMMSRFNRLAEREKYWR